MSTLRVTAGTLRGRRVPVPRQDVRPTSERARQAFFNMVAQHVDGCDFLDLFAGSGIFSFEAVSRGARTATAVDLSEKTMGEVQKRADAWGIPIRTIAGDVRRTLKSLGGRQFDLVYADPPYDYRSYDELITDLGRGDCLADDAIVGIEHAPARHLSDAAGALVARKRAQYGSVAMTLYHRISIDHVHEPDDRAMQETQQNQPLRPSRGGDQEQE